MTSAGDDEDTISGEEAEPGRGEGGEGVANRRREFDGASGEITSGTFEKSADGGESPAPNEVGDRG